MRDTPNAGRWRHLFCHIVGWCLLQWQSISYGGLRNIAALKSFKRMLSLRLPQSLYSNIDAIMAPRCRCQVLAWLISRFMMTQYKISWNMDWWWLPNNRQRFHDGEVSSRVFLPTHFLLKRQAHADWRRPFTPHFMLNQFIKWSSEIFRLQGRRVKISYFIKRYYTSNINLYHWRLTPARRRQPCHHPQLDICLFILAVRWPRKRHKPISLFLEIITIASIWRRYSMRASNYTMYFLRANTKLCDAKINIAGRASISAPWYQAKADASL